MNVKSNFPIFLVTIVLLLLSACSLGKKEGAILLADDELIQVVGRTVCDSSSHSREFAYPGVSVKVKFEGKDLSVSLKDILPQGKSEGDCFYIIIDEKDTTKIQLEPDKEEYLLFSSQEKEVHSLEMIKLTEAQVGRILLKQFSTQTGTFLPLESSDDVKKLLFIGNSITCGYGVEDSLNTPGFHAIKQNVCKACGGVVSQHYGAHTHYVAYSGRGLYKNYLGDTVGVVSDFFERTIPDDPTRVWNHADFDPDVIVVNIGTNDFSSEVTTGIALDSVQFVSRCCAFLQTLRQYHSFAKIVCVVGPMISDDYPVGTRSLSRAMNFVNCSVELRHSSGDNNVYFFSVPHQQPPYGEDYHPSEKTQRDMANRLITYLDCLMGW